MVITDNDAAIHYDRPSRPSHRPYNSLMFDKRFTCPLCDFSERQVMLEMTKMKIAFKKMTQQLNTTGGGRDLGPLEPFWPWLQRIYGKTHFAELPANVGVDVDPRTGLLVQPPEEAEGSETQFSPTLEIEVFGKNYDGSLCSSHRHNT